MDYTEFSGEQRRQLIDVQQVYAVYSVAIRQLAVLPRYRWQAVKGKNYLYEARGKVRKSLGAQSEELDTFKEDRASERRALVDRVKALETRLDEMAPINRAMGLGRLPKLAGRILRALDKEGLLGDHIIVAGTNALYAYEALAGVRIGVDHLATGDADLIWDTRHRLMLAGRSIYREGLIGLLRRVDHSFVADYGYNATNRDGYIVDLLCAETEGFPSFKKKGDLLATPMPGMSWLLAAPRREAVLIAEDGYPVRMVVPDALTFALHKMWVAQREDRTPIKKKRDRDQADIVADLAMRYFGESPSPKRMDWLSDELREQLTVLADSAPVA